MVLYTRRIEYVMSGGLTCQSNSSQRRRHNHLPNWNPKNGEMLISQQVTNCLTNHSQLCMSRLLDNQSHKISIYRLQRQPSFTGKFSVSSALLTSAGRAAVHHSKMNDTRVTSYFHLNRSNHRKTLQSWIYPAACDARDIGMGQEQLEFHFNI